MRNWPKLSLVFRVDDSMPEGNELVARMIAGLKLAGVNAVAVPLRPEGGSVEAVKFAACEYVLMLATPDKLVDFATVVQEGHAWWKQLLVEETCDE